ncbi:MAG: mce related protein [Bacteroidetes bacterium ADurb.Bin408]|nr:MAG: mce related protein [Bacteroidetes bacterium ADurb.Bin408]
MKIKREHKIGIVFIAALLLFIWGFTFLKGRDLFLKEKYYYAVYPQVNGLVEGSVVQISGIKVGRIESLYFHPDDAKRIVIRFSVRKSIPVPKNSVARIFSSDLLGTRALELQLGDSKELAEKGDTLRSEIQVSISEEVSIQMLPFKKKAEDLMLSIDSVMAVIQYIFNEKTSENIKNSFESISQTISNLEQTSYTFDTLVSQEKGRIQNIFANIESISLNIRKNNQQISNVIENLSSLSDTLAKANFISVINNTDKAMKDVQGIVEKINRGEGSVGMLINNDSLYKNLEKSSLDLDKLLEDMRVNPNRYVHFSVFGRKNTPPKD